MTDVDPEQQFAAFRAYAKHEIANKTGHRRVVALLDGDDLARFLVCLVCVTSVTRRLAGCALTVVYRDRPEGRTFLTDCSPEVAAELRTDPESDITIPIDWFDIGTFAPVRCPDPVWSDRQLDQPALVLLPGMFPAVPARLDAVAEAPPTFRLPAADAPRLRADLMALGLDPEQWFAVVDDAVPPPATDAITRQGGLVAPSIEDLPTRAAAVCHARLVVAADPLTAALAGAFRVPCAWVGGEGGERWLWNRDDIMAGGLGTPEILSAITEHLLGRTVDVAAWRPAADPVAAVTEDTVVFPLRTRDQALIRVWR